MIVRTTDAHITDTTEVVSLNTLNIGDVFHLPSDRLTDAIADGLFYMITNIPCSHGTNSIDLVDGNIVRFELHTPVCQHDAIVNITVSS